MPERPASRSRLFAALAGACMLAGFDISSAYAQGYGSSGLRTQGRGPMMGSRGGMSGRGGMHGGYRPGWGHRGGIGLGYGYGVPLGAIEAPYDVIERDGDPGPGRRQRPPRRKTADRDRQPQKPVIGTTA
jgi:hypothetical protein